MPASINANGTQAYYGEEAALGVQSPGPFYPFEANSYSDWGVDVKTVTRSTLNISRQQSKGTQTETSVVAGLQQDFTQNNHARLMQGYFVADTIDKPSSRPTNGAPTLVNAMSATQMTLAAAVAGIGNKSILKNSGFINSANNGPMLVSAVAGAVVSLAPLYAGATVVEAGPPVAADTRVVGYQLSNTATLSGMLIVPMSLTDTGGVDFTTLGLNPGEWIYIGDVGNAVAASNYNFIGATSGLILRGFARIAANGISATKLLFDFCTFGGGSDATAATTAAGVRIWFGHFTFNQSTLNTIKQRTYTLPRYLGRGAANADQLEVLLGNVADKLTINVPLSGKVTADATFIGINAMYSNTAMLAGTVGVPLGETAYNTSQDMVANLLTVNGTENNSLFAYGSDSKFAIDNGCEAVHALGSQFGFDVTLGDFKTTWSGTAYFADIAALTAIQNNVDVGAANIFARANAGWVFDIPLLTLGGGKLKLDKDKKITADITGDGARNAAGYTASYTRFPYLPSSAMAKYSGL